jgi:hypothetical protein
MSASAQPPVSSAKVHADVVIARTRAELPGYNELPFALVHALIAEAYTVGVVKGLEQALAQIQAQDKPR